MADWKAPFNEGVASFRAGNLENALELFSKAISLKSDDFTLYDSRAAVCEKLGKTKDALLDSKKVIDLAPHRWQGYARSARLFLKINKFNNALHMANLALEKVAAEDTKRHGEIIALRDRILQGVERQKEQASRMFYHFGKLPLEIAATIFALVLADDHAQVVRLSQVSQNWRSLILGTPTLWGTLVLSSRNPVKKAKVWAARSKGRLVELHLRAGVASTPWALDELTTLSLSFLRTLELHEFPVHEVRNRLPALTADRLRNLNEFGIWQCTDVRAASWLWSQAEMRTRALTVDHSVFNWACAAQNFQQLEFFSFKGPVIDTPLHDILSFLRANPRLRRLILSMMDIPFGRPTQDSEELINLPHLTQLELEYHDFAMSRIFPMLALPSLRVFHVRGGIHSLDGTLRHLIRGGSAASLTELRIQRCAVSAQRVIELLHSAVALETLQLEHVGGSQANKILEALGDSVDISRVGTEQSVPNHSGPTVGAPTMLCPSLTHVNLSHCPDIKSGPLLRLVKSRLVSNGPIPAADNSEVFSESHTSNVAAIQTLIIDGCPAVDVEILPWLRSKVSVVSCVYMTKKDARSKR